MEATKEMLRPAASKARSDKDKKKTKRSHHGRKSTLGKDDRSLIKKALGLPKGTPPEMTDENTNPEVPIATELPGVPLTREEAAPARDEESESGVAASVDKDVSPQSSPASETQVSGRDKALTAIQAVIRARREWGMCV